MGYSPWGHEESDPTEHLHRQAPENHGKRLMHILSLWDVNDYFRSVLIILMIVTLDQIFKYRNSIFGCGYMAEDYPTRNTDLNVHISNSKAKGKKSAQRRMQTLCIRSSRTNKTDQWLKSFKNVSFQRMVQPGWREAWRDLLESWMSSLFWTG